MIPDLLDSRSHPTEGLPEGRSIPIPTIKKPTCNTRSNQKYGPPQENDTNPISQTSLPRGTTNHHPGRPRLNGRIYSRMSGTRSNQTVRTASASLDPGYDRSIIRSFGATRALGRPPSPQKGRPGRYPKTQKRQRPGDRQGPTVHTRHDLPLAKRSRGLPPNTPRADHQK